MNLYFKILARIKIKDHRCPLCPGYFDGIHGLRVHMGMKHGCRSSKDNDECGCPNKRARKQAVNRFTNNGHIGEIVMN